MIHIHFKFNKIPFSWYLVMAQDGQMDRHRVNNIPLPLVGIEQSLLYIVSTLYCTLFGLKMTYECGHIKFKDVYIQ